MTLAQVNAWSRWHARSTRSKQRDLVNLIRAALTAEPEEIEQMFTPEPSADQRAKHDAAATAALSEAFGVEIVDG
jgi:hypothetical protein